MTEPRYAHPDHSGFRLEAGPTRALLIHGFMGTPQELRPLGEELAAAGVSVRSILLPGFGPDLANLPRATAREWIAAAAAAWREEREKAERAVLVGFSMGGAIAAAVARDASPDTLILLAPHVRFADRRAIAIPVLKHVMREFRPFSISDFANPAVRATFSEMAPGLDLDDPAIQQMLCDQAAIPTRALDELRRTTVEANRAARLISAPTVIVQGEQDPTSLPAYTRAFASRLGAPVEYVPVPGNHMLVDPVHPGWPTTSTSVVRAAAGRERA